MPHPERAGQQAARLLFVAFCPWGIKPPAVSVSTCSPMRRAPRATGSRPYRRRPNVGGVVVLPVRPPVRVASCAPVLFLRRAHPTVVSAPAARRAAVPALPAPLPRRCRRAHATRVAALAPPRRASAAPFAAPPAARPCCFRAGLTPPSPLQPPRRCRHAVAPALFAPSSHQLRDRVVFAPGSPHSLRFSRPPVPPLPRYPHRCPRRRSRAGDAVAVAPPVPSPRAHPPPARRPSNGRGELTV